MPTARGHLHHIALLLHWNGVCLHPEYLQDTIVMFVHVTNILAGYQRELSPRHRAGLRGSGISRRVFCWGSLWLSITATCRCGGFTGGGTISKVVI
ncbi:hypothetical protein DEU56DRAFT_33990 [Suillus clintonianus]|uniref:uncharacterized protein n=1 Tax=Suillus clintonianus TaxID=1904413 RepID=UPI001B8835A0|nr:uncharacterized protein DEU56DRAFT_33990 [Suillus clintonianus]KAG2150532.1 hypothetical protein DEU56DRAFT_33990 [Suillus clintonianus]